MSEKRIKVIGNCILLPDGKSRVFPSSIKEHIVYREMVFVLLECTSEDARKEHVFALNEYGDIIWQIGNVDYPGAISPCPFTNMNIAKQTGDLLLYNACGILLALVPETGKILENLFTK